MTMHNATLTALLELQDFLGSAPDSDDGDFERWHDAIEVSLDALEQTRQKDRVEAELAAVTGALGEPCAECGHIDWRADPNLYLDRMEAAEAEVTRLRAALETIASHPHGGILVNIAKHALRKNEEATGTVASSGGEQA